MTRSKEHPASTALADAYLNQFPDEAVRDLEREGPEAIVALFAHLEPHQAGALGNRLTPATRSSVLQQLKGPKSGAIIEAMDPVKVAVALSQMSGDAAEQLKSQVSEPHRGELMELMSYPVDSAWQFMDGDILTFQPFETAGDALQRLRASGTRNSSRFYLVDEGGFLQGLVRMQDLALAPPELCLGEIAQAPRATVSPIEKADEVMRLFNEAKTSSIPVVTSDRRLLGAIRYDGLIDAAKREALEGLQSMVGVSPEESALSSPFFSVRKRLPWLQINLVTAFLAAAVVGVFEGLISEVTALAVLLPVVAGQSGNTGAQALAVTLRSITLKEVRLSQWMGIIRKECATGFMNGVAIAAVTGLGVWIWSRSLGLVVVISVSMIVSMVIAGCAGAAVPIVLKSLRQDPAQSSSIILTTVTDVFGFFSFLGLATLLIEFLPVN